MQSKTNRGYQITASYIMLGIDLCTALLDYCIMMLNRRRKRRTSPEYDLSRSYQISENVTVTTGLVLPLDLCNVLIYITYMICMIVLRTFRPQHTDHRYGALVELVSSLTLSQAPLSLLIGLRFLNNAKRKTVVVDPSAETDFYFRQLHEQWN
ncbi:hypothetical protein AAVH_26398 [Aphelenchoides avenae]|nr:hypothetical protein AAVH_26398 [Aphelenchus avenae]